MKHRIGTRSALVTLGSVVTCVVLFTSPGNAATKTTKAKAKAKATTTTATPATTSPPPKATSAPTTAAPALSDSYRGVTSKTIKVGLLLIDAKRVLEVAGVDLRYGNNEGQYREAIDAINAAGGVNGRRIDPVFLNVDPLSPTAYDAACVKMTQDEKVFAVIGFVRPASSALCYTERGDTPFVGFLSDITSEVIARSKLPLITSNALPERVDRALVDVLFDAGELKGKNIAVLGTTAARNKLITDQLEKRGLKAVSATTTRSPSRDTVADAAELDVITQRWISDKIDFVIDTAGLDRPLAAANRAGFQAKFATNIPSILSLSRFDSGATMLEIERTMVVTDPSPELLLAQNHKLTVECVSRWNKKHPEEQAVLYPKGTQLDNLIRIVRTCQQVGTFALIAEKAGPDLTTAKFKAAVDLVGSVEVPLLPLASLKGNKWDMSDSVSLYRWDRAKLDFVGGTPVKVG